MNSIDLFLCKFFILNKLFKNYMLIYKILTIQSDIFTENAIDINR